MPKVLNRLLLLIIMTILFISSGAAQREEPDPPPAFSEAEIFVELNDTDGDLGLHASIDGEPWLDLEIEGPGDRQLLNIFSHGRVRAQGLTQLFLESAEPGFDELDPADFFRRFPEGRYTIEGRAQEGGFMEAKAVLSHVMAAPPGNVRLNGVPAATSCEAPPPMVVPPVMIDWDPVTQSHPTIGKKGHVSISRYQFFVERDGVKLSVDLPPTITEFEVPAAITNLGKEFKYEIIARTESGNNTALESCFVVP